MAAERRVHVVVVPYPGAGNINPALQIAKLLHRHGAYVTFVNTEHNHRRVHVQGTDGFRFEAIPDGLSESDCGKQDYGRGVSVSLRATGAKPLRELIEPLNREASVPRVTCVLFTALVSFALGVASELGVPTMAFWGGSAASLMAHMRIRELVDRGLVPLKDGSAEHQLTELGTLTSCWVISSLLLLH